MMKPRFFNPALALTMACLIALPAAPGRAETPADTLVVADTIDDIISLDPAQSFELSGGDVIRNLYDRLVDFDPLDLGAGIQPSLASAWQVSEDGRTITLTLREGALFQSGNPAAADAPAPRSTPTWDSTVSDSRISMVSGPISAALTVAVSHPIRTTLAATGVRISRLPRCVGSEIDDRCGFRGFYVAAVKLDRIKDRSLAAVPSVLVDVRPGYRLNIWLDSG